MSKENNLTDFLTDVADAIREKKGTTDKINPQEFSDEIKGIKTSSSIWTGHVDVEGLKAIGWDDDDIAYFQEHGVNWMEEDDEYYKVSDDNKALYGVLTADNIKQYKDRIVWLPKIDTSEKIAMLNAFDSCVNMVGLPLIDTSNVTDMGSMFRKCHMLTCIPIINTSKVKNLETFFIECHSLMYIPLLDVRNVKAASFMFAYCYSLTRVPAMDFSMCKNAGYLFYTARKIENIEIKNLKPETFIDAFWQDSGIVRISNEIDLSELITSSISFANCTALKDIRLKGLKINISFSNSHILSKKSLLYIIENENATEPIVITLQAKAYARLSTDPDIVAALENHPLVSLASA